jgi:hypothetical protein
MADANIITDADYLDTAQGMIRYGSAAFLQMVTDRNGPYFFYGHGFEVRITRTDPDADYPGKPDETQQQL